MTQQKTGRFNWPFWGTGAAILIVYLIIDLRWVNLRADDFYYGEVIEIYGSLENWFSYYFQNWGGRLIQLPYVLLLQAGIWPFRVLNFFVLVGQLFLLFRLCGRGELLQSGEATILLLFTGLQEINIVLLYESMLWPAGMVSYFWCSTCMLVNLWVLQEAFLGEKVSRWKWGVACLAAGYASCFEMTGVTLTAFLAVYLMFFLIKHRPIPRAFWAIVLITLLGTALCLLAPGNAVRTRLEALVWWPDFEAYGPIRKFVLGGIFALDTLQGDLLRYLLIAAAMLFLANWFCRRWLPLGLSLIPVGYYGLAVLEEWFPWLRSWLPIYDYLPGNNLFTGTPWNAFCTFLGVFVFVLFVLTLFLSADGEGDWINGFLALAAFANLFVMCASPTIYVTGGRGHYLSNLLINLLSLRLWHQCLSSGRIRRWELWLMGSGIVLYAAMIAIRTILRLA